jgi:hypothetical protein
MTPEERERADARIEAVLAAIAEHQVELHRQLLEQVARQEELVRISEEAVRLWRDIRARRG